MEENQYHKHPLMWLLLLVMLAMLGLDYLMHLCWRMLLGAELGLPDPLDFWR